MPTPPERIIEQVTDLVRRVSSDAAQRTRLKRRRAKRTVVRYLKIAGLMWFSTAVIVIGMIATGRLFGPSGAEGWIATPLMLLATWALILFWFRRPRRPKRVLVSTDLVRLPARTEEWLEEQRRSLPTAAQGRVDDIVQQLESLVPQLVGLDQNKPSASEVRRLLGEELPELLHGYQRVPVALRRQPLHGGATPDQRLVDGLATIHGEIERMQARLAADDLHALAVQGRYLQTKYKGDDDLK